MRGTSTAGWILAAAVVLVPSYGRAASLEEQQPAAKAIAAVAKQLAASRAASVVTPKAPATAYNTVMTGFKALCGPSYDHITVVSDPPGAYVYGEAGDYWDQTTERSGVVRIFDCQYGAGSEHNCWPSYTVTLRKPGYKTISQTFPFRFTYRGGDQVWDCEKYQARALAVPPRPWVVVLERQRND